MRPTPKVVMETGGDLVDVTKVCFGRKVVAVRNVMVHFDSREGK